MKSENVKKYVVFAVIALVLGFGLPRAYSAADQTYQHLKMLVEMMEQIKANYVDEVDSKDLIYGAASGMVRKLDDFSQFMEPGIYKRVKSDTEGEFGGLGIRIIEREGYVTVVTPMPNTPAYKAGILPGDRIVKVEDTAVKDVPIDDVVEKLRGSPGTKVKITIAREPEAKNSEAGWTLKEYTLERAKIVPDVVQYRMMENKIAYIRLFEFTGHAVEETIKALNDLKKQGMEALVLDLRYNPGGLLTGAVDISKFFIGDNKMIVYTKGRRPETYQEYRSGKRAEFEYLPMVVLVNGGSASASEIVAGAMQDNHRAVIVGSKTFGKASVQTILPLSDGSGLRLTIAKYYTPSGRSIHRNPKDNTGGISPDIEVKVSRDDEIKVMQQYDKIYTPGKDPVSPVKKGEEIKDEALSRSIELLRARAALVGLSAPKPQD